MPIAPTSRAARRIKLKDLLILEATATTGTMAGAAQRLALTQSAISKAIAGLEATVGAPLLERDARGVAPTAAGRILLARGRVVADELAEGMKEIAAAADPTAGEIRIGVNDGVAPILARMVDRLSRRHPRIRFAITVRDGGALLQLLQTRDLDLVLHRWIPEDGNAAFRGEPLFNTSLAVVAGERHRLAARRRLSLAGLMDEAWALSPPETTLGQLVGEAFAAHGLPLPEARITTLSVAMRLYLLGGGQFVTMLPRSMARMQDGPRLRALAVPIAPTRGAVGLITLRRRPVSGIAQLFMETARGVARAAIARGLVDPP
ncbi:MAG: LysR family transcriptional regulator [Alphaproteobacteria bacterium]